MTAIGIFLAFIGLLIGALYGAPLGAKYNFYDRIGQALFVPGLVLTALGLLLFVWRTLP